MSGRRPHRSAAFQIPTPTRSGWTLVRFTQHDGKLPDLVAMRAPVGGVLRAWVNQLLTERFAPRERNLVTTSSLSGKRLETRVSLAVTGRLCAAAELTELACMPGASCPRCEGATSEFIVPEPGVRQVIVASCGDCGWRSIAPDVAVYEPRSVVSAR